MTFTSFNDLDLDYLGAAADADLTSNSSASGKQKAGILALLST